MVEKPIVIWTNVVDKKYQVQVTRTEDRKGVLKVKLDGVVIGEEDVTISYGAQFGPDAADVNDWCDSAIKIVDKHIEENKPATAS